MRKGAEYLYNIEERVKNIKHYQKKFNFKGEKHWYEQLTKEAGGLYTLLRKLKREKKIQF